LAVYMENWLIDGRGCLNSLRSKTFCATIFLYIEKYTKNMGRAKLIEGAPCRHGHPWNRTLDGKRCLTCYPPAVPKPPQVPRLLGPYVRKRAPLTEEQRRARRERDSLNARLRGRMLREDYLATITSKPLREAAIAALRAEDAARKKVIDAAKQLRAEKAAQTIAKRVAQQAVNDERRRQQMAARAIRTERHLQRLARIEKERAERKLRAEAREAMWAAKRAALTPAQERERKRRNRKRKGWMRQSGWRAELWHRQGGRCALTGLPLEGVVPHLDHIIPKAKGGDNSPANMQWTHPVANHAKHTMSVKEFQEWLLAAAAALRAKQMLEALL